MAKRPRLSTHLRLAEAPDAFRDAPENGGPTASPTPSQQAEPPAAAGDRRPEELIAILSDAGTEMTRLSWLGWSKGWDTYLRLSHYWLGMDRLR